MSAAQKKTVVSPKDLKAKLAAIKAKAAEAKKPAPAKTEEKANAKVLDLKKKLASKKEAKASPEVSLIKDSKDRTKMTRVGIEVLAIGAGTEAVGEVRVGGDALVLTYDDRDSAVEAGMALYAHVREVAGKLAKQMAD